MKLWFLTHTQLHTIMAVHIIIHVFLFKVGNVHNYNTQTPESDEANPYNCEWSAASSARIHDPLSADKLPLMMYGFTVLSVGKSILFRHFRPENFP